MSQAVSATKLLTVLLCRQQVNRLHGEDHLKVTKPNVSSSINQSNDDLWTDEDESLIRATQAFLDVTPKATRVTTVGRLELSKDVHVSPAVSSCSTLTTSTPNICSRVSRVTFGLEPASADAGQKFNGQSKHAKVTLPSASRSRASFAIAAENSCKEFLAKLTEPNVVLNTQASDGNGGDGVKSPGNKRSGEWQGYR
jgi:hypothetical protein